MSMIMKQLVPLGVAIAMAVIPMRVQAQEAGEGAGQDRTSTVSEVPRATPRPFEELDQNADGAISKDEAAVDPPLAQVFGTLDKDADGRLSPEEYAAYAQGSP